MANRRPRYSADIIRGPVEPFAGRGLERGGRWKEKRS
jgi:hypothetical protein